jgi:hypothetical protein
MPGDVTVYGSAARVIRSERNDDEAASEQEHARLGSSWHHRISRNGRRGYVDMIGYISRCWGSTALYKVEGTKKNSRSSEGIDVTLQP